LGYLFVIIVALTFIFAHFIVDFTLLSSAFFFFLLVVALIGIAAQTAIADTINGILILIDQPFRGGDDIYINEIGSWGEVVSIGLRSTRIHTGDNREITVPNSIIGTSQIINYSHPDPTYRVQIEFVAVGKTFDELQQLIEKTIRGVEGVLPDKPINVIYLSFGGTGRDIRVRWWIEDANNQFTVQNRVFVALEQALAEAGVETPNLTYNLNVQQEADNFQPSLRAIVKNYETDSGSEM
jgi:small-conductance mechanosensitive channel